MSGKFASRTFLVVAHALMLCAPLMLGQEGSEPTLPRNVLTVHEGPPPFVRLTVAHYDECWGVLDISRESIAFVSFTNPAHSFRWPKSQFTQAKLVNDGIQVRLYGPANNLVFGVVEPEAVQNHTRITSDNVARLVYKPSVVLDLFNDFDQKYSSLKPQAAPKREEENAKFTPAPQKPKPTTLKIRTEPGNVEVYLDGRFQGHTSEKGELIIESIPGEHELRLDLKDFKEWQQSVSLRGEEQTDQSVTFEPAGPKPLDVRDVEEALSGGLSKSKIIALVRQYGVSFAVTSEIETKLRSKGADSDLLFAIAQNKK